MEIKLDIYKRNPDTKKKEFDRTVVTDTVFLPLGIIQDLLKTIDIENVIELLSEEESNTVAKNIEIAKICAPLISVAFDEIILLLLDTFETVTEDELQNCNLIEVALVIVTMLKQAYKTMFTKQDSKKK